MRPAFSRVLPLLALVQAVLLAPLAATPAEASDTGPLRIGTYNIRAGLSEGVFATGVQAFAPRVDVAGLQEVNSRDKEAVLGRLDGWDYFRAPRYYGEQHPVLWRQSEFRFVAARTPRLAKRTYVGAEVPGKSGHFRAQYATVVRLVHRATGERLSVVNVHLPPGAVRGGEPYPGRPRLFRFYAGNVARAGEVARAEKSWGRVYVLGDFNAGWVADERRRHPKLPFMTFRGLGMRSMWATERPASGGTHDNGALLDQVFAPVRADTARVQTDLSWSDHRPAVAGY